MVRANSAQTPSAATLTSAFRWLAAGQLVSQVAWFASLIILGALLTPRAFGTVAAGMVVITVAALLLGLGTQGSIVATRDLTASHVRAGVILTVSAGVAISIALLVLAGPLLHTFASGGEVAPVRALGACIALQGCSIVPMAILQKELQFKRSAHVTAGGALIASVVAVLAAVLGAGVWALVIRQLVNYGFLGFAGWIAARPFLPRRRPGEHGVSFARIRRAGARAFLVLSVTDFVALTADNLVVGRFTDAALLGLYSFAFTLSFAPLKQISWQLGLVLFPAAAATTDLATVGRRTLKAVRVTALVLLPLVPLAITLAPVAVPAIIGEKWNGMVVPFQILLVVGVTHALVNLVGESLSGTGNIGFRARVNSVWAIATLVAVFALVQLDGLRGAALAHLCLIVPLAAAYAVAGSRLIGADARRLWEALRDIVLPVAVEAAAALATVELLLTAGVTSGVSHLVAAGVALAVVTILLAVQASAPLREARDIARMTLRTTSGPEPAARRP